MENKTGISKKKVVRFLIGAVLVCLFGGLLIASSMKHRNSKVKDINITLSDAKVMLMPKEEYKSILTANEISDFEHLSIKDLNLEEIEGILESSPWIEKAEAYIDNNQILQLDIKQNIPSARIFTKTGGSFFLDTVGNLLPVNVTLPVSVPVFTNVPPLSEDEMSTRIKRDIAYLGSVIAADSFWNAQITQIEFMSNGSFELMTIMGNHKVLFGDTSQAKAKLNNLFLFYKNALTKVGWDRYQTIDIRYKNQVVTSPAMGYIAPIIADTAIDLPDPDDGAAPVNHNPQVVVSDAPVQNNSKPATATSNVSVATAPKKEENKKTEPKKVEQKKSEPKKETTKKQEPPKKSNVKNDKKQEVPKKNTTPKAAPKASTAKDNKTKQPKHLLPGKNK